MALVEAEEKEKDRQLSVASTKTQGFPPLICELISS
jgi:hypothetical protein